MRPILDLLHQIQWDKRFRKEEYEIGYEDMKKIKKVKFTDMEFEEGNKFSFTVGESEIPFHRIRRVWRKGKLVWKREK